MFTYKINAQMSEENENLAIQKIKEMESLFPFLVNLSSRERREIRSLGKGNLDFVEKALVYSKGNQHLVPPCLSIKDQEADLILYKQMQRIMAVLDPFYEKIHDTFKQVGAEAYASARAFYSHVKTASAIGEPGTDSIAKSLGKQYEKQSSKQVEPVIESKKDGNSA